jgi:transporter family-2 protein
MLGFILSILSGMCMSIQGVFNSRLSEKIGVLEANVFVQGTAFLLSTIILIVAGKNNFKDIKSINKLYLLGGVLAVVITYTVITGICALGTTYAISTILISQLITAAAIDAVGLFGTEKIKFGTNEIIGVIVMLAGILIFKWRT